MGSSRKKDSRGREQDTAKARSIVPSFVLGSLSTFKGTMRTRSFERAIRQTFPFLDLPPEIRIMVYYLVLGFQGVSKYLLELAKYKYDGNGSKPVLSMTTPSLLLVCKQITAELFNELPKIPLLLPNIYGVHDITTVITPNVLRNLQQVTIDVRTFIDGQCMILNVRSIQRLALQLARVWAFGGHNVKKLTVRMEDSRIDEHFTMCPPDYCYIRSEIETALDGFSYMRDMKNVSLEGLMGDLANTLVVATMMGQPLDYKIMELPKDIRNKIYEYTLDWNEGMAVMDKVLDRRAVLSKDVRNGRFRTKIPSDKIYYKYSPPLLRVNKEIRTEAMEILLNKTLTIDATPPKKKNISDFISAATLQQVRKLNFEIHEETMGCWGDWEKLKNELSSIFAERNSLQSVTVTGTYKESSTRAAMAFVEDIKERFGCDETIVIENELDICSKSPNTREQSKKRPRED